MLHCAPIVTASILLPTGVAQTSPSSIKLKQNLPLLQLATPFNLNTPIQILSFANAVSTSSNTQNINTNTNSTLNSLQELAQDNELILILQTLHKIAPQIKQATSMQQKMLIVLTAFNIFNNYFLGGDLNSHHRKWNCSRANSFGINLYKFTNDNRLHIAAPPTPTRYGTNTPSTIDIALFKNLNYRYTCESVSALTSDHNPVIYHFDLTIPNIDSQNYNIPNWSKFTQHLSTAIYTPHDLNTISGIEDSIKLLTDIVYTCHDSTSKHISSNTKFPTLPMILKLKSKKEIDSGKSGKPLDTHRINKIIMILTL
ncbi:RNA-directed DNA polymerase from mobile element jockey [Caerostris extrusa]|uniref:RNA-directed DNA polymerase from mobile element jockey n=1 Tax=Caerostris extrusa TaxID=172846 RepID=A0AAV4R265_CAEEX|nr:RNA-directed DNA polymerase from mobile element jockey [Caerostris extrusa]